MQYITPRNVFARLGGVCACDRTPLLKGPGIFSLTPTKLFRPIDEVNVTLNAENFLRRHKKTK